MRLRMSRMARSLGKSPSWYPLVGLQGGEDLGGGQVAVAARRLQFRVGLGVGLDDGPDVCRQLRVLLLAARVAAAGKFPAADTRSAVRASPWRRCGVPSRSVVRPGGVAVTEGQADLGLEESALMPGQPLGPEAEQFVARVRGVVHGRLVPDGERRKQRPRTLSHAGRRTQRKFGETFNCRSPKRKFIKLRDEWKA